MTDPDKRTELPVAKRVHCHRTGRDFETISTERDRLIVAMLRATRPVRGSS